MRLLWRIHSGQIGLAKNDWILSLDADERLSPGLILEIQEAIRNPGDTVGFLFPRCAFYLNRWIYHGDGDWYPNYQLRLERKRFGQFQGTNPHDRVFVNGKTRYLKCDIYHFTYENISRQLKTIDSYSNIFDDVTERGKRFSLFPLILRPLCKFMRIYIMKMGFLGWFAWIYYWDFECRLRFCKICKAMGAGAK